MAKTKLEERCQAVAGMHRMPRSANPVDWRCKKKAHYFYNGKQLCWWHLKSYQFWEKHRV